MANHSLPLSLGNKSSKSIDNDFPISARTALIYLIENLNNKGYLVNERDIINELNRLGRIVKGDIDPEKTKIFINKVSARVIKLEWYKVYYLCERIYANLLISWGNPLDEWYVDVSEIKAYFTSEINSIMVEENLAFHFVDGQFQRRGRAQTQKAFERVGVVLADQRFGSVKNYYNKARKKFDERPIPDFENCVKEALCSLEACIEILTGKNASNDFEKSIKRLEGNGKGKIPFPIGEGMIKLHSYRGSGQGVAHAALKGNRVDSIDAELVLSLTASYITYLIDLFPLSEEIPF